MNHQYPLQFPPGWERTRNPKHSKFKSGSAYAEMSEVVRELKLMKARDILISSNMQIRNDGLPYARQNVSDTGVAVYFTLDGEKQCIPCDKWVKLEDNIRAIHKTIEALRGIERWGAKEMMKAAFTGFKALPAQAIVTPYQKRAWYEVLAVSQSAPKEVITAAYKSLLKQKHPDVGGSEEEFLELQAAYREATS